MADSHKMKLDELRTLIRAPFPGCGTYSNRLVHLMTARGVEDLGESRLCNGFTTAPKYGLLGLMSCCRSLLLTVCELILHNPGIPTAVVDAETVRFRR
jgi:hypothetical protein